MAVITDRYQKWVLDDMKQYVGLAYPLKAGLLERMLVTRTAINKIHPNPEDEFSMPEIGPNYEIIENYAANFRKPDYKPESLIVEKISTGGYMLLNGHHRWFAAHTMNLKKYPVRIVNVTSDEELISRMNHSAHTMCVSFDLDEVLMTDGSTIPTDRKLPFLLNQVYPYSFRKNAPALIANLHRLGFDVWIFSKHYHSEERLQFLCKLHHITFDGIIHGMEKKQKSTIKNLRQAFSAHYKWSLHIDNQGVICVNTQDKSYDSYDIPDQNADWGVEIMKIVKGLDIYGSESK